MASPTPPPERPDPDSIAERLKQRFGDKIEPTLPLDPEPAPDKDAPSTLFDKLRGAGTRGSRYRLLGEVARGGMGVILKIWDDELRRTLAMKVVLGRGDESKGDTPHVDPKTLGRFLEEAQVTGQLDHPGIVPVHELGLAADGRVYFTMRLVKGEDLRSVFEKVRTGEDGWNQVRALGVLLKVCEAMSYAHSKKVVHRDLKPANVMVGKFGEVYVMDWGLARVLGRKDRHDMRIQPQPTTQSVVKTERREKRDETPDSPLVTMDGDIVGTPSFMPPEQAKGQLDRLGPHSDVYALGAMLYQLLTGQMPYVPRGAVVSQRTILEAVLRHAPEPIESLAPRTPPELVAVCEKAMAREVSARYAETQALASDLRAYLEGRVVRAYEAGTWAETRKWVMRNKSLAASLAAAVVILAGGVVTSTVLATRAMERTNDVLSLSAQKDLDDLVTRAEHLWPANPEMVRVYEWWLEGAHELIAGRPADRANGLKKRPSLVEHKQRLSALRANSIPPTEDQSRVRIAVADRLERKSHPVREHLAADVTDLEPAGRKAQIYYYENPDDGWWDKQLSKLVGDLEALGDPMRGLMGDTLAEPFGWGVTKRLRFAQTILERSIEAPEARARWDEAIASIKSSAKYQGLALTPQLGLLPISADGKSGLWEFAHLQTGAPAVRGADGKLTLSEETGLVFVLVPGGAFWMGAQKADQNGQNYDPQADEGEFPVHEVELSAYFLSKYEMTQGQWERIAARDPSYIHPAPTLLHPVESVSWTECMTQLDRLGLILPSEAQWEYGARGGTSTPWWTGAERESLRLMVNIADQTAKRAGGLWPQIEDWADLDDGAAFHAIVGHYAPNGFGLHDVCGNVLEWCLDEYAGYRTGRATDPITTGDGPSSHICRGGAFSSDAKGARIAIRQDFTPEYRRSYLGLRPARGLTP